MNRQNDTRRGFLKTIGTGAAVLLGARPTPAVSSQENKPNILFFFTDDQRWDTIAALGNPEIRTPNLDRLVTEGFHFSNAYCMGSMVGAVCLPSRTMLATGRSLWRIPENPRAKTPPPGVPLLPVLLNEAGYVTFHSGKAGNACTFSNALFQTNIETRVRSAQSATEHTENAIKFLRAHDGKKPFFIYLAPPVPHDPRLAPAEFTKFYDPAKLTLSKNFMPQHPFDNGDLMTRDEKLASHPRTAEEMRRHLADYYATISHLDHEVGRVLDTVAERGWAANTVVIYSSDQGLAVGGRHGLMGKQNLYEHVKPPLIFAGPGIPHGRSDALVYLYDLLPTICDLAGAETPDMAEGRSLLPVIAGRPASAIGSSAPIGIASGWCAMSDGSSLNTTPMKLETLSSSICKTIQMNCTIWPAILNTPGSLRSFERFFSKGRDNLATHARHSWKQSADRSSKVEMRSPG